MILADALSILVFVLAAFLLVETRIDPVVSMGKAINADISIHSIS
jgi:hypothetical protein